MSEELLVDDLIEKIFSKPPKGINEIKLSFANMMGVKDLFEFLLTFITNGSKLLFGKNSGKVYIAKWTDIEFNILNKYCKSIGYEFILDRYSEEEEQLIDFKSMSYKNKKFNNLTHLHLFKLPIKCNNDIFVFSFKIIEY